MPDAMLAGVLEVACYKAARAIEAVMPVAVAPLVVANRVDCSAGRDCCFQISI
jgi:hypothetical protein